ncbi:tyrosine protein-kinase src-1-like [Babylonia areolata]|uniref:tyrosine protein-kinase src-1-like n=1 Tax=Babylonia areolata TaxID=304850 RepID=UPI003FD05DD1
MGTCCSSSPTEKDQPQEGSSAAPTGRRPGDYVGVWTSRSGPQQPLEQGNPNQTTTQSERCGVATYGQANNVTLTPDRPRSSAPRSLTPEDLQQMLREMVKKKEEEEGEEERGAVGGRREAIGLENIIIDPVTVCQDGVPVKALFDFHATSQHDLSFKKGDRMKVALGTIKENWMLAKHMATGVRGYIPGNFVRLDNNSLQAEEWWFEGDRAQAEVVLMLPGNPEGTFLVRHRKDKQNYALSVRQELPNLNTPTVDHFKIENNEGFFSIQRNRRFPDISSLVQYYLLNDEAANFKLTSPYPRLRPCEIERRRPLEIARSHVTVNGLIATGKFGAVFKGLLYGVVEVAVKKLHNGLGGGMTRGQFLQEAELMRHLRHPKVVRVLGVCHRGEPLLLVMELMVNGSLLAFLRSQVHRPLLSVLCLIKMAAQIADGMQYLESEGYVHRDLRAANVLVGERYEVKVGDFGLSRKLSDSGFHDATVGGTFPLKWTAPETETERRFSAKTDVWSFGVFLHELFTLGEEPYLGQTPTQAIQAVMEGYRLPKPQLAGLECPNNVYDMMLLCWDVPDNRPTFRDLKKFFDNF